MRLKRPPIGRKLRASKQTNAAQAASNLRPHRMPRTLAQPTLARPAAVLTDSSALRTRPSRRHPVEFAMSQR